MAIESESGRGLTAEEGAASVAALLEHKAILQRLRASDEILRIVEQAISEAQQEAAAALTSLQLDACCVACAEGNHQQCLGGRCACIHDSRMPNAEAALADQRQLVARLRALVEEWRASVAHWRSSHPVAHWRSSHPEREQQADAFEDCAEDLAALVAELSQEAQEDDQSRVD